MIVVAADTEELPTPPPAKLEQFARLIAASGLLLVFICAGSPILDSAALSVAKEVRIIPRLSVFLCALLAALLLGGTRWNPFQALAAVILFGTTAAGIHSQIAYATGSTLQMVNAVLFAAQTLAILFTGVFLGGMIRSSGDLLFFLACAVAGDICLNALHIPDNAAQDSIFALLRLHWPQSHAHLAPAPGFGEILVCGALAASAPRLHIPLMSIVLGAFAGYSAASFLALPPWPAWPTLSVLLITTGTLIGCWPDLDLTLNDLRRALLISGALMLVFALFSVARYQLLTPPKQTPEPFRYRSFI